MITRISDYLSCYGKLSQRTCFDSTKIQQFVAHLNIDNFQELRGNLIITGELTRVL